MPITGMGGPGPGGWVGATDPEALGPPLKQAPDGTLQIQSPMEFATEVVGEGMELMRKASDAVGEFGTRSILDAAGLVSTNTVATVACLALSAEGAAPVCGAWVYGLASAGGIGLGHMAGNNLIHGERRPVEAALVGGLSAVGGILFADMVVLGDGAWSTAVANGTATAHIRHEAGVVAREIVVTRPLSVGSTLTAAKEAERLALNEALNVVRVGRTASPTTAVRVTTEPSGAFKAGTLLLQMAWGSFIAKMSPGKKAPQPAPQVVSVLHGKDGPAR